MKNPETEPFWCLNLNPITMMREEPVPHWTRFGEFFKEPKYISRTDLNAYFRDKSQYRR